MPPKGNNERPGQLRHQVTINDVAYNRTTSGQAKPTLAPWQTVWASIEPLSGKEFFVSAQLQGEVSHRIRMRFVYPDGSHPEGVTPKMWITFTPPFSNVVKHFDIRAVINIEERPFWIDLICRELQGAPGGIDQP